MISQLILRFIHGSMRSTTDIESFGISIGFKQRQILGGIGYLRRRGLINIVSTVVNPSTGRSEHLFN